LDGPALTHAAQSDGIAHRQTPVATRLTKPFLTNDMHCLKQPSITVVTATLNAARDLPRLIKSLENQTDKDFSWAVFDGGSTDTTPELIQNSKLSKVELMIGRDFGIYDALNQCLERVQSDYYLVCGADDELYPNAIEDYRACAGDQTNPPDFVAAKVRMDDSILHPREGLGWLLGMPGIASSHAVGLLIRTSLHARHGKYSRKFPIAADQLFVGNAHRAGAVIHRAGFIAGRYGTDGLSGSDLLGTLTEAFRVQRLVEPGKLLQVLLFIGRLLKHYRRI
jgi:glycosyltransferase involved in cell wall biosynthesis